MVLYVVGAGTGAVATWYSVGSGFGVDVALFRMAGALVLPTVIHLRFTLMKMKADLSGVHADYRMSAWLSVSSGFALIALISRADAHVFTFALKGLVDAASIAAFFAATKTVEVVNMFLIAVTLVASTHYAKFIAVHDGPGLQRCCNANLIIQNIPSVAFCALVVFFNREIMAIFDPEYAHSGPVLILLAIAMLCNSLSGATGLLLQLGNMHWISVFAQGGAICAGLARTALAHKRPWHHRSRIGLDTQQGLVECGRDYLHQKTPRGRSIDRRSSHIRATRHPHGGPGCRESGWKVSDRWSRRES